MDKTKLPIVGDKDHSAPSVFRPEALLREARYQRLLEAVAIPEICVLDPDGDVVRYLKRTGVGRIPRRMGLLSHRAPRLRSRRHRRSRHRRLRCRRTIRRIGRRAAFRVGLPSARQRDFGRSDQSDRAYAVLCPDRPPAARRGDELSLSAGLHIRRGARRAPSGSGGTGGTRASHTSRIPWHKPKATSKRAKPTAPKRRLRSSPPRLAAGAVSEEVLGVRRGLKKS